MFSYTSYRGRPIRGRGRGSLTTSLSPSHRPTPADLMRGLGDKIAAISLPTSDNLEDGEIKIDNFRTVASYNWVEDGDKPTVVIPGEPAIWAPPSRSFQLTPDSKPAYLDQPRAHVSKWPVEPLLRSLKHLEPQFDLSSVDVITSRNNLRKLLRFALGTAKEDYFRIDVELIENTLVLMRWEAAQVDRPSEFRGYGANFHNLCTRAIRGDAPVNHRSVTYDMGGLKFLVGCHVDAQVKVPTPEAIEDQRKAADQGDYRATDPDDLLNAFNDLSVTKSADSKPFNDSELHYIPEGTISPDDCTLEIHTRSGVREFEYFEAYVQMYLTQTAYLVVARHNHGYFTMPAEKRALDDAFFERYKDTLQSALKKLVVVLKTIKEVVKEKAQGKPLAFIFDGTTLNALPIKDPEDIQLPIGLRLLFGDHPEL